MTQEEYEEKRTQAILKYNKIYKDTLAFDLIKADKTLRVRLLRDPIYVAETKACKAHLFEENLDALNLVLSGTYSEAGKDNSNTILKALEMKQKLLLEDLSINQDDNNAMNITFTAMSKEDFEALDTVEIFEGSNTGTEMDSSFGKGGEADTAEGRMKEEIKQKLKEQADKEAEDEKGSD